MKAEVGARVRLSRQKEGRSRLRRTRVYGKGSFPQERQVNEILEEWSLPWSNLDSMV